MEWVRAGADYRAEFRAGSVAAMRVVVYRQTWAGRKWVWVVEGRYELVRGTADTLREAKAEGLANARTAILCMYQAAGYK